MDYTSPGTITEVKSQLRMYGEEIDKLESLYRTNSLFKDMPLKPRHERKKEKLIDELNQLRQDSNGFLGKDIKSEISNLKGRLYKLELESFSNIKNLEEAPFFKKAVYVFA